ncbi:MAG TPA: LAGLIDADG family homing endonuclease [Candidatus Paceibacterota bacterium]|nr:LAGLIDADG family homing endonuclease [Candidatus Paceibacterota bacterium]
MRVLIDNPKDFFKEILEKERKSLNGMSKKLLIHYSPLKRYARGELTIPKEVFDRLIKISPRKNYWIIKTRYMGDNWGQIKGGKKSSGGRDMDYVRKFRQIKIVKIRLNKFFCEFYGLLLGDGCISTYNVGENKQKTTIIISGNKRLDSKYLRYMKERIKKEFGINAYYYEYKNKNVCTLSIRNKKFALDLNSRFNVPIGIKYNKLRISKRITSLPWHLKKHTIKGLFDSDGSIYARKDEEYKWPIISIRSKNPKFLEQICNILRKQNYPAYFSRWNVSIRGIKNIKKWFKDIGSSNQRNILKYQYFLKNKRLPPKVI